MVALALGLQQAPGGAATEGMVVDAGTERGISGATVSWRSSEGALPGGTIQSAANGAFRVPADWTRTGVVEVRAFGYRTLTLGAPEASAAGWRLFLHPDPLELDALVMSAAPGSRRRADVAVPILEVDAAEIARSGAESVERLLADLPGLQAEAGTPVGSNIMIRGIGGARVLILIDGQPASGALMENRDLSRLSLAGVERVEVVKGPLSSLYGSDALGGVINIITRDPQPGLNATVRALTGSQGRKEADATVGGGRNFLYRVTGAWRQQDAVAGLVGDTDAFARVWDARSTFRWAPGALSIRSDLSFLRERQRWPVGGGFSGFNDNRGLTGWTELETQGTGGTWMVRILGQRYEHLYRTARGNAPIAGTNDEQQIERLYEGTLGFSRSAGRHSFHLGLEGATRFIRSPDKVLQSQASDDQFELFAQDDVRIGAATLSAGARWTLNDSWGNALSPSVGSSIVIGEDLLLRVSLGRGFRAPSFKELGWDFANLGAGYTVQGNPDLRAESSWNASSSVQWAAGSSLTFTAEAFRNEIDNLIDLALVRITEEGLFVYSPRNISRAVTQGVEIGATTRHPRWSAALSYAYLDAKSLPGGMSLDRRARHSGRARLSATPAFYEGLQMDFTTTWTGEAPIITFTEDGQVLDTGTQGALTALDAQLSAPTRAGIRLFAGVDNLLDQRPAGWPAVTGRRLRAGIEVDQVFRGE